MEPTFFIKKQKSLSEEAKRVIPPRYLYSDQMPFFLFAKTDINTYYWIDCGFYHNLRKALHQGAYRGHSLYSGFRIKT